MAKKRSFFERLTGSVRLDEDLEEDEETVETPEPARGFKAISKKDVLPTQAPQVSAPTKDAWMKEEEEEGQLTVDLYQTPTDMYVETMVAGVRPEDLQISITRDLITIRGKREQARTVNDEDFFCRELYWGTFSRTISLPAEVEAEGAEAIEKHGLLVIRLPKINKDKQTQLRVKSV